MRGEGVDYKTNPLDSIILKKFSANTGDVIKLRRLDTQSVYKKDGLKSWITS